MMMIYLCFRVCVILCVQTEVRVRLLSKQAEQKTKKQQKQQQQQQQQQQQKKEKKRKTF